MAIGNKEFWDRQPLGEVVDRVIAERLGCNLTTVFSQRQKRGIPPFRNGTGINWSAQPFGKMTDEEWAKLLGCSPQIVAVHRNRRGIPHFVPLRSCKVCGKDFRPIYPQAKYCSPACRKTGGRIYNTEYVRQRRKHAKGV